MSKENWKDFELIVAKIQSMMDKESKVTHNEKIIDRHGHRRQFDVVIRSRISGRNILGVIECKDLNRKVGTPEIDAFITKSQDINANISLVASRRGFTKPALEKAKFNGIGTISLLPEENVECGFKIGKITYLEIYRWTNGKLDITFQGKKPKELTSIEPYDIRLNDYFVYDWFNKELVTTYLREEKLGWFGIKLVFEKPVYVNIKSNNYLVLALIFRAYREKELRSKFIQLSGTVFFDWENEKLIWPPGGSIETNCVPTDISEWDLCEMSDPPKEEGFRMLFKFYNAHFDKEKEVIDLENY